MNGVDEQGQTEGERGGERGLKEPKDQTGVRLSPYP